MKLKTTLTALILGTLISGPLMAEENDRREHDGERDRPHRREHDGDRDERKCDEVNHEKFKNLVKRIMEKHPDLTREEAIEKARKYLARKKHDRRGDRREAQAGEKCEGDRECRHPRFKALLKRLHEEHPDLSREELVAKAKKMLRRKKAAHEGDERARDGKRRDERREGDTPRED